MSAQKKSMLPFYLRMLIAIAYIIMGIIMLTTDAGFYMTGTKLFGTIFGIACLAYGAFRMYRARQILTENN
jgi:putative effector of murein hydrolase